MMGPYRKAATVLGLSAILLTPALAEEAPVKEKHIIDILESHSIELVEKYGENIFAALISEFEEHISPGVGCLYVNGVVEENIYSKKTETFLRLRKFLSGYGTGFWKGDHIASADHVVTIGGEGKNPLWRLMGFGKKCEQPEFGLKLDDHEEHDSNNEYQDVTVLLPENEGIKYSEISVLKEPYEKKEGDIFMTSGYPEMKRAYSIGTVNGDISQPYPPFDAFSVHAFLRPGYSGGPGIVFRPTEDGFDRFFVGISSQVLIPPQGGGKVMGSLSSTKNLDKLVSEDDDSSGLALSTAVENISAMPPSILCGSLSFMNTVEPTENGYVLMITPNGDLLSEDYVMRAYFKYKKLDITLDKMTLQKGEDKERKVSVWKALEFYPLMKSKSELKEYYRDFLSIYLVMLNNLSSCDRVAQSIGSRHVFLDAKATLLMAPYEPDICTFYSTMLGDEMLTPDFIRGGSIPLPSK
ncbi:hypothetical protein GOV11_03375 [Candidatus Woesearchaeota archaeon]|nr:hypothetical protein [Candidatus Woesearchaeota archaeon]